MPHQLSMMHSLLPSSSFPPSDFSVSVPPPSMFILSLNAIEAAHKPLSFQFKYTGSEVGDPCSDKLKKKPCTHVSFHLDVILKLEQEFFHFPSFYRHWQGCVATKSWGKLQISVVCVCVCARAYVSERIVIGQQILCCTHLPQGCWWLFSLQHDYTVLYKLVFSL